MARYEKAARSEFWELRLEGKQVVVYGGTIGMQGKATATEYPTAAEAKAEHDKLVAQQVKKGFVPVPDLPDTARYDRFERAGGELIEVEVSDRGYAAWFGKGKTGRGVEPFPTLEIARSTPAELLKAYEDDVARWRADGYALVASDAQSRRTPPPPPKVKPSKARKKG